VDGDQQVALHEERELVRVFGILHVGRSPGEDEEQVPVPLDLGGVADGQRVLDHQLVELEDLHQELLGRLRILPVEVDPQVGVLVGEEARQLLQRGLPAPRTDGVVAERADHPGPFGLNDSPDTTPEARRTRR
jgi:hypothetical protein